MQTVCVGMSLLQLEQRVRLTGSIFIRATRLRILRIVLFFFGTAIIITPLSYLTNQYISKAEIYHISGLKSIFAFFYSSYYNNIELLISTGWEGSMHDAYSKTGVDSFQEEKSMKKLLGWINQTFSFRDQFGKNLLPIGFFANVIDIGNNRGLALSMDGVGTKILVAEKAKQYDTIGIDCVAMNVNDLLCLGAEPVSFMDYIAVSKIDPTVIEQLAKGFYEGARLAHVNIPGGELAQVKELLHAGDNSIDLVGTAIGIVDTDKIITGKLIQPGDIILGLPSHGIHSNGLTLARKLLLDNPAFNQEEMMKELLIPTAIYVDSIMPLLRHITIHGMAHITGEGFLNILRLDAKVLYRIDQLPPVPQIFRTIQNTGGLPDTEMYKIYNMGIGFVVIVDKNEAQIAMNLWEKNNIQAYVLGEVLPYDTNRIEITPLQIYSEGEGFSLIQANE